MKNKKKILVMITIAILLIILISTLCIVLLSKKNTNVNSTKNNEQENTRIYENIQACNKDCDVEPITYYLINTDNNDTDTFKKKVEEINNNLKTKYDGYINSLKEDSSCSENYKYSNFKRSVMNVYENDEMYIINIISYDSDLCTNNVSNYERETYYYNKNYDRFINNDEFLSNENISIDEINANVYSYVVSFNNSIDNQYMINNIKVDYEHIYYSKDGELFVPYCEIDTGNCFDVKINKDYKK